MPLGWYLAQGLIPLGPSSSDDEEGPCELPDGRLVCGPHGRVTCHRCCSDFSFMDDVPSRSSESEGMDEGEEDEGWDDYGPKLKKGTGRVFPAKFVPPSASVTPLELFSGRKTYELGTRYTLRNDTGTILIHTDGACLNNGQPNPTAGWAFWHGFRSPSQELVVSGRLEKKGPFGDGCIQTSNRAELRAVIAALRFLLWPGEGFHTCVIATDSQYMVKGSTEWAKNWVWNDWMTRKGPVKNRDLWEALLGEVERYDKEGMAVKFWNIPREWNTIADAAAKDAAAEEDVPQWLEHMGTRY